MADKYGIPEGGDPYPGRVRFWKGQKKALSWAQVAAAADKAGWSAEGESNWAYAVSVTGAESGRVPTVYNTYKKGHFGLWQISRSAHPEFFAGGSEQWTDPVANAREALRIWRDAGKSWRPWEGSRHTHILQARSGIKQYKANKKSIGDTLTDITSSGAAGAYEDEGLVDGILGAAADTYDAATSASRILGDVWEALTNPSVWMRIAYGATAVILIGGGLFLITGRSPAVQDAAKSAMNVAPQGKALKAVKGAAA